MSMVASPLAKYLDGIVYIVYGPGASEGTTAATDCHPTSHYPTLIPECHSHSHSHQNHLDQPAHFWAVFRPNTTTYIPSKPTSQFTEKDCNNNIKTPIFFLKGSPYPWGTYPSDMSQPHGCIPPHLYYHVSVSQLDPDNFDIINKWRLPFVHRIGDGNDHAGGLTTKYSLLRDQEDAEDHGAFIDAEVHQLQHSNDNISNNEDMINITPNLYACTEVLISERRILDVIQQQFFIQSGAASIASIGSKDHLNKTESNINSSDIIDEFREYFHRVLHSIVDSSPNSLPFSLVQADLKLILPFHVSSSPSSSPLLSSSTTAQSCNS